jgi:hypothetical protein
LSTLQIQTCNSCFFLSVVKEVNLFVQLVERVVPVIRKKSPQDLRRNNSMEW